MTCERSGQMPDASIADALDGCTPSAEICGDGIDQDCDGSDLACATNDQAAGAIDVTAGGTFTADALLATDDVGAASCGGGDGGRDLFYRVHLTSPEVYYVDTFGSSYDTNVRVYNTACTDIGSGANDDGCADDECGGGQTQLAVRLPVGDSCIVVDQADPADSGDLTLTVMRGGRDGFVLARGTHTTNGDTTNSTNLRDPIDMCDAPGSGGRDVAYFVTVCPSTTSHLDADICPAPAWDPNLYVTRVDDDHQLACNDDTCDTGPELDNIALANGRLFILYVDGWEPEQYGPFTLHTTIH
jgi:hypothetical protein